MRLSSRSCPLPAAALLLKQLLKLTPEQLDARWPRAFGAPLGKGRIRVDPEDFLIQEMSQADHSGAGEHLWLLIRKTECNTEWVACRLAGALSRPRRDVGYAGRKDRRAVAEQWFSIRCPSRSADLHSVNIAGVTVLDRAWHDRKLRRGYLKGNRFSIRVRQVAADPRGLEERLSLLAQCGAPNYFGLQRFGRGLSNLARAVSLFEGARLSREHRSLALSAARSLLFNEMLAARVAQGRWSVLEPGDMASLAGSRSVFRVAEIDEEIKRRLAALDIHPTASLVGHPAKGVEPAVRDQAIVDNFPILRDGLIANRVEVSQRPTRVVVGDLSWRLEASDLRLQFTLPPGAYATAVLREILSVA